MDRVPRFGGPKYGLVITCLLSNHFIMLKRQSVLYLVFCSNWCLWSDNASKLMVTALLLFVVGPVLGDLDERTSLVGQ